MNRFFATLFVTLLLLLPARFTLADLNADVNAILHEKLLTKSDVGIEIVKLSSGKDRSTTIFRHNSEIPLIPASNLKIATTSAFLEKLGPNFKFRTLLVRRGDDLILVGDGDPSLGDAEMLRKVGWDATTVFSNWAETIKKQGITSVANVAVDDSVFDENFVSTDWPAKQQHLRYQAEVGGMNLNANCLDFYLRISDGSSVVAYLTNPSTQYATIRNSCMLGRQNSVWLSREPGGNS